MCVLADRCLWGSSSMCVAMTVGVCVCRCCAGLPPCSEVRVLEMGLVSARCVPGRPTTRHCQVGMQLTSRPKPVNLKSCEALLHFFCMDLFVISPPHWNFLSRLLNSACKSTRGRDLLRSIVRERSTQRMVSRDRPEVGGPSSTQQQ